MNKDHSEATVFDTPVTVALGILGRGPLTLVKMANRLFRQSLNEIQSDVLTELVIFG